MEVELSVVMPCLDEAETLGDCIEEAMQAMARCGVVGEVVVADNGSSDGSPEIARRLGARVVEVTKRGYGCALRGGIEAARGRYVVMADADRSYQLSSLGAFVEKLREGYDLVMGNRFQGRIEPGAMPWQNRWIGNPALSGLGRLFFGSPAGDFHCGLRAFSREAYRRLGLRTSGMEFASEMVVKATLRGLRIAEVPTVLRRDGRSRPAHLRRWRDGWRHLRFMLLYTPRWLFLLPGAFLMLVGASVCAWLFPQPRSLGPLGLDVHTMLVSGALVMVGYQLVVFAAFSKVLLLRTGAHPPSRTLEWLFRYVRLEVGLAAGLAMLLGGAAALGLATWRWQSAGFGALDVRATMRLVIPSVVLLALGIQTVFASFFLSLLGTDHIDLWDGAGREPCRSRGERDRP